MARKPKGEDDLQESMRRAIIATLKDPQLTASERARVIEAGVKILALEHKIRDRSGATAGSFFSAESD